MNWRGREEIPSSNHLAYKSLLVTLQPGRGCEGTPPAREGKGGDSLLPGEARGIACSFRHQGQVSGRVLRFQGSLLRFHRGF